jgi:hypothetical protein
MLSVVESVAAIAQFEKPPEDQHGRSRSHQRPARIVGLEAGVGET